MRLVRTYIMVRWIRFPYEHTYFLSPLFHISISFKLHQIGRCCFNGGLICPSSLPFLPSLLSLYVSTSLPHFLFQFLSLSCNLSLSVSFPLSISPSISISLYLSIYLSIYLSHTVPLRLSNSLSYTSSFSLDLPLIDRYRR